MGGIIIIFHYNLQVSKECKIKIKRYPLFYQELIQLWIDVSKKEPSDTSEICKEVLWNNKMIISKGESLFNKHFIEKGIILVKI